MTIDDWVAQREEAARRRARFDERYGAFWNAVGLFFVVLTIGFVVFVAIAALVHA